ncbi:MAG: H-X9-DG-CTERM domain-containing protein, partial [Armatimonadota bacterium]
GTGMLMYTDDYDGVYVPHITLVDTSVTPPPPQKRWPQLIDPYIKNTSLQSCPSGPYINWSILDQNSAGLIAYGITTWMSTYINPASPNDTTWGSDANQSTIARPAETAWVLETGGSNSLNPTQGYYIFYPSIYGGKSNRANATYGFDYVSSAGKGAPARLADRHNEGSNVLWCDGHVKWLKRSVLDADTGGRTNTATGSKYFWGRDY